MFNIVKSWPLRLIINIAVAINVILLASQYNDMGHGYIVIVYWINVGFTALFALEAVVKIIILTPAVSYNFNCFIISNYFSIILEALREDWRFSL